MPRANDLDDFESIAPPRIDDIHLRVNTKPDKPVHAALMPAPQLQPSKIKTSFAEQKALAVDATAEPEIRQRAMDFVKCYTSGYEKAAKEYPQGDEGYRKMHGIMAIMMSGRADFAAMELSD